MFLVTVTSPSILSYSLHMRSSSWWREDATFVTDNVADRGRQSQAWVRACGWTHGWDSGDLSAGTEQATLQQVSLLNDALHGCRVIRAHLDLLAGRQQGGLQGVLAKHTDAERVNNATVAVATTFHHSKHLYSYRDY